MQQQQAYEQLPKDANWSCSFGYPGNGGFVEYYRTPHGARWQISNGPYDASALDWTCREVAS